MHTVGKFQLNRQISDQERRLAGWLALPRTAYELAGCGWCGVECEGRGRSVCVYASRLLDALEQQAFVRKEEVRHVRVRLRQRRTYNCC